eukprot:scaffold602_cov179-Ochromonas_danica.AAC.6
MHLLSGSCARHCDGSMHKHISERSTRKQVVQTSSSPTSCKTFGYQLWGDLIETVSVKRVKLVEWWP